MRTGNNFDGRRRLRMEQRWAPASLSSVISAPSSPTFPAKDHTLLRWI